jgi:hypothetical protein
MQVLTMIELQGATPGQLCSMMTRDWAFDEMSLKDVESQDRHELNGHFLSFFFVCKCNTLGKEEVNEVLGGGVFIPFRGSCQWSPQLLRVNFYLFLHFFFFRSIDHCSH